MMEIKRCLCRLFEYETPRFVTVRYLPLGILKIITQICVLVFVVVYEMYYAKGYQTFANVRSSVTTKVISSWLLRILAWNNILIVKLSILMPHFFSTPSGQRYFVFVFSIKSYRAKYLNRP